MWIIVATLSYILLAVATVFDKYILTGPLQSPKIYTFLAGILGGVVFILIPFGFLEIPNLFIILFALLAGMMRIFMLLSLFSSLKKFEASRIIPILGGITPLFTLLLVFFLVGQSDIFSIENILAFVLLVAGTVVISLEGKNSVNRDSLVYATVTAFFFSLFFVFSKFVFDAQPFFSALIWLGFGYVATSLLFFFSAEVRAYVFGALFKKKKKIAKKEPSQKSRSFSAKIFLLIVLSQIIGGGAIILQNFAISLVPFGLLAFVNALAGVQYLFLFFFALFLSMKFPQFLKEKISGGVILQKIISILLIGGGLALIAFGAV